MQIDTANNDKQRSQNYKDDLRREKMDKLLEKYDGPANLEKQRMAVEIFGDSDDELQKAPAIKEGGLQNSAAE